MQAVMYSNRSACNAFPVTTDQEIALSIAISFGVILLLAGLGATAIVAMGWSERQANNEGEAAASLPPGILIKRALARMCPICGRGAMFSSYLQMRKVCPACGARFWKNEGEWVGPAVIDYSIAAAAAVLTWIVLAFVGANWILQIGLLIAAAFASGVAAIPWTRSLWTLFLFLNGETGSRQTPPA